MPRSSSIAPVRNRAGLAATLALGAATASAQATPPPPPPPYSLPWLLRPATPASVVRLDETMAFYEDPASGSGGASYLTGLIATRKLSADWGRSSGRSSSTTTRLRPAPLPREAASRTRSSA